jgi:hypothetical protein
MDIVLDEAPIVVPDNLHVKESEPGDHTILLYGQHREKEKVAYEVARRISKFSLLNKNGNMISVEYPAGADYNDAYEEAKEETANLSPPYLGIREAYHASFRKRTDEVLAVRENACKLNPDKIVLDIHETTDFNQDRPELRRNEIVFLTALTDEENAVLNEEFAKLFPDLEDVNGYMEPLVLVAKNPRAANTSREFPQNLVVVEIKSRGDDIYEHIANKERIYDVGRDEREDDLHRMKDSQEAVVGVNREATIYTRLLEKVIPAVESYYSKRILAQK